MRIKRESTLYLIGFIGVLVVCNVFLLCTLNISEPKSLSHLGVITTIELIAFLFINMKINGKMLNFATVFILVLYVFNFGQLFIYTFLREVYDHVRFMNLLSLEEGIYGFRMINHAFSGICLGILMVGVKSDNTVRENRMQLMNDNYDWIKVAKTIILFTFPVKFLIDMACLAVSMTQGGPAARAWMNAFPNVLVYYGKISLVGFALLLVILKNKPKMQMGIFLFIEAYILLAMVSGIRSENVGYLLIFAFLYFVSRKNKLKFSTVLICGVIGFCALTFVVAVGDFRGVADKSIESFMNTLNYAFTKKNVIFSLLDTLGDTGYTALCVVNKWLPEYGPFYGASYYKGIMAVIPNIPGVTDLPGQITASSCFPIMLQKAGTLSPNYTNIGGSLIGELFFNFGLIGGVLSSVVLGMLLGYVSKRSSRCFDLNNYYDLIKYIPFMFMVIYWVRDYFGGGIREAVWGPVFCYLVLKCMNMKKYVANERLISVTVKGREK